MTDPRDPDALSRFVLIERALADHFDQPGVTVTCEYGEWYAWIGQRYISLSKAAYAITQKLGEAK